MMTRLTRLISVVLAANAFALPCASLPASGDVPGIAISYRVPRDGMHVTIAINNAAGVRVRNLIADVEKPKGKHTEYWDGLDDDGRAMPPGEYRWVGLTRGDLHAVYRGKFVHGDPPWFYGKTGGWLADHHPPCAVVSLGETILIGSGVSEWGHGLVCCDLDGTKQWGVRWLSNAAWCGVASMATDGERVFATSFPGWQVNWIWEVDPKTGNSWPVVKIPRAEPADPKTGNAAVVPEAPFDPPLGLRVVGARRTGPTRWDGELFISDLLGNKPRTFVYGTARAPEANDTTGYYFGGNNTHYTMKLLRTLPVKAWGLTWLPDGRCVAVLDKSLGVLDTATGAVTPLVTQGLEAPYCITSDSQGRIYVSDRGGQAQRDNPYSPLRQPGLRTSHVASMQVKVFDSHGKPLAAIGKPGGQGPGVCDSQAFDMPGGIAIDARGRLWVSEENLVKRISVWSSPADPAKEQPALVHEFTGTSSYGEGAYMRDPRNPQLITSGLGKITWEVDLRAQTFRPVELPFVTGTPSLYGWASFPDALPFGNEGFEDPFDNWQAITHDTIRLNGRTYQWYSRNYGSFTVVGETVGPGSFKPLAAVGTIFNCIEQCWRYSDHWVPLPILEACKRSPDWEKLIRAAGVDPAMAELPHAPDIWSKWPKDLNAFAWADANGDGLMQADEITIGRMMAHHGAPVFCADANLNLILSIYGSVFRLKPQRLNALGAPIYDWSKLEPVSQGTVGTPSAVLDDGSILITAAEDEAIRFLAPDGRQRWSYRSRYREHSHRNMDRQRERVTTPGAIYGAWNMPGIVNGPGKLGKLFMLHSGHGMNYLLTLDGLFIGTIFKSAYDGQASCDNLPEAKLGMLLDDVSLQDECFNGSMARAEASAGGFEKGRYYMLGLGRRVVVELAGLDSVERLSGGKVKLNADAVSAARAAIIAAAEQKAAGVNDEPAGILAAKAFYPQIFGHQSAILLPAGRVILWHNESGLGVAATTWYRPGTPLDRVFVNDAPGWEELFAHGDCIDVSVGAAGPDGGARPEAQDERLVFGERAGKLEIVRYRRMPASQAPPGAKMLDAGRDGAMCWVADTLDLPNDGVRRHEPIYYNTTAVFSVVIPWKKLGIDYAPGMRLRANAGITVRRPGFAGLQRMYWVGDVSAAAVDLPTALEMRPGLWRSIILRPDGYVFPPAVSPDASPAGRPLVLNVTNGAGGLPAACPNAFMWVSGDTTNLKVKWYVARDATPFVNNGTDWTLLFKSGDACDLQIESPTLGKNRILVSVFEGKPVVVRYQCKADGADPQRGVRFRSPAGDLFVPIVERMAIEPNVQRGETWYTVEAAIPWAALGIKPDHGMRIPIELGVLRSDPTGTKTISRDYWNSGLSGMVTDVPTEARPTEKWGVLELRR